MARQINLRPTKPQALKTSENVEVRSEPSSMEIASLRASIGELEGVVEQILNADPPEKVVERTHEVRIEPTIQETIILEDPRFTKLAADMGAMEKTLEQIKKKKPENVVVYGGNNTTTGGGGITDGDKGDIIVSGSGATWTIDPSVLTAQGRAIIDDANAGAQRTTLGLQGTGVGLAPSGGSTTQVLAKLSNSDYDYAWASAGAGGGGTQFAEDTPAVSGDLGDLVLTVRRDTDGVQTSTDGDYAELQTDASGFLKVIDRRAVYPINDNGGSITVDGAVTVSGTVAATQSGTWTVQPGNTANTTAWKVDGSAVTQPVSGTIAATQSGAWSLSANQSTNVAQVAGTATDTNSGVKSAGTIRVVLATDQPQLTNKLLVTPDSVALPANQSVNVNQINAVTPLMGNGVTGTGSQRVTIASDNTAFSVNANIAAAQTLATVTTVGTLTNITNWGNIVDDAAFTPATTRVSMSGYQADETATDSVDEGDGGAARMTLDRKQIYTAQPHTQGGTLVATGSIGATVTSIKASAGQVYGWHFFNANATTIYVQFFNTASGSVTLGTTTPVYSLGIPTGGGATVMLPTGVEHTTAIVIAVTTTRAGSTGPASTVDYNVFYK